MAKFGGVAILAGRYKKETSKSKKPKKDRHSDCTIEVLTAFEVTPKFDDSNKNLATDFPEIDKVLQITEHLNLTVVGLSIGCKASEDSLTKPPPVQMTPGKYKSSRGAEKKDKESMKESSMWKPTHVYTTLQLKSKLPTQHNDSLIIITTATTKSTSITATRAPAAAASIKSSSPSKGSSSSREEGGLLLEAYQLSDQAIELFTKNILSYQQPVLSNYKDREKAKSNIFLNSEVLLKV